MSSAGNGAPGSVAISFDIKTQAQVAAEQAAKQGEEPQDFVSAPVPDRKRRPRSKNNTVSFDNTEPVSNATGQRSKRSRRRGAQSVPRANERADSPPPALPTSRVAQYHPYHAQIYAARSKHLQPRNTPVVHADHLTLPQRFTSQGPAITHVLTHTQMVSIMGGHHIVPDAYSPISPNVPPRIFSGYVQPHPIFSQPPLPFVVSSVPVGGTNQDERLVVAPQMSQFGHPSLGNGAYYGIQGTNVSAPALRASNILPTQPIMAGSQPYPQPHSNVSSYYSNQYQPQFAHHLMTMAASTHPHNVQPTAAVGPAPESSFSATESQAPGSVVFNHVSNQSHMMVPPLNPFSAVSFSDSRSVTQPSGVTATSGPSVQPTLDVGSSDSSSLFNTYDQASTVHEQSTSAYGRLIDSIVDCGGRLTGSNLSLDEILKESGSTLSKENEMTSKSSSNVSLDDIFLYSEYAREQGEGGQPSSWDENVSIASP